MIPLTVVCFVDYCTSPGDEQKGLRFFKNAAKYPLKEKKAC
jgi:hypothetical protein